jgi:putative ABC transport system permease protein
MSLRWLRRIKTLVGRRRVDAEIQRELAFHLAMESAERERHGMAPADALRTTLQDFGGGVTRVAEDVRDVRGITFWDACLQDVRFGIRTLRRSPGFTLAAIVILALGIGANTAIFSVISGVLLKPLPFHDGHELVLLQQSAPASRISNTGVGIPELWDYRKRLQSVRDLVEYHGMSFTLLNQGEPDAVSAGVVSANFFDMLGVRPIYGRTFADGDDDLEAPAVLVLSYEYWQQKFGADPNVVGRVLQMNNKPHTIIGVLPAFPQYPAHNDVYMPTSACPFRADAERKLDDGYRTFMVRVFGRLAPGATRERAAAEIAGIAQSFPIDHPDDYKAAQGFTGSAVSLQDQLVVGARPLLFTLAAVAMLVLLIAAANVANLTLAHATHRQRELAVRAALGASRARLFRQLMTESLIVSAASGIVGLWLASFSLDLLVGFVGRFTPRTGQIAIDTGVLWFTVIASIATGVLFGAAPAFAARRTVVQAVRDGTGQTGDRVGGHPVRACLVVSQVAISFVLVVGAVLLLESVRRLATVSVGFDTDQVMAASVSGNFSKFSTNEESLRIQTEILTHLRRSPGVRNAAITSSVPLANRIPNQPPIRIEGRAPDPTRRLSANPNIASDGFFDTLGVPMLAGREFRTSDDANAPMVAIINLSMTKYWDGTDPIGTRFTIDRPVRPGSPEPPWFTVVGIVKDFHLHAVDNDIEPQFYTPFNQALYGGGSVIVRADGPVSNLPGIIRAAVRATDSEIPIEQLQTLEEFRTGQLSSPGLTAALLTIFAVVALLITLAGIAGVVGTSVSQRTREFGLRIALGASRASVLSLVLRQALVFVVTGVVLGVAGAYVFGQVISGFLFETAPTDGLAYGIVATLFVIAALLATFGPARRATSIDPLQALRME